MHNLIDCFLGYGDQFRVLHWQTKLYARHVALGEFYDTWSDTADKFIETYQGKYGRLKTEKTYELKNTEEMKILEFLNDVQDFLEKGIPEHLDKEDTDLLNLRDGLLGDLKQLRYLLTLE